MIEQGEQAFGLVSSALGVGMAIGGLAAMRIRPRFPLRAGAIALFGFCLQPLTVGLGSPAGLGQTRATISGG